MHEDTDNSLACLQRIAADAIGSSICDVGCGTGALLTHVRKASREPIAEMVGVDMIGPDRPIGNGITFVCGWVEDLPFADKSFDTVVCTHVIEHIRDPIGQLLDFGFFEAARGHGGRRGERDRPALREGQR